MNAFPGSSARGLAPNILSPGIASPLRWRSRMLRALARARGGPIYLPRARGAPRNPKPARFLQSGRRVRRSQHQRTNLKVCYAIRICRIGCCLIYFCSLQPNERERRYLAGSARRCAWPFRIIWKQPPALRSWLSTAIEPNHSSRQRMRPMLARVTSCKSSST